MFQWFAPIRTVASQLNALNGPDSGCMWRKAIRLQNHLLPAPCRAAWLCFLLATAHICYRHRNVTSSSVFCRACATGSEVTKISWAMCERLAVLAEQDLFTKHSHSTLLVAWLSSAPSNSIERFSSISTMSKSFVAIMSLGTARLITPSNCLWISLAQLRGLVSILQYPFATLEFVIICRHPHLRTSLLRNKDQHHFIKDSFAPTYQFFSLSEHYVAIVYVSRQSFDIFITP